MKIIKAQVQVKYQGVISRSGGKTEGYKTGVSDTSRI